MRIENSIEMLAKRRDQAFVDAIRDGA